MSTVAAYACQTCGACCVQLGPYDGTEYVYLDRDEASVMRSHGLPVVRTALGGLCLGARPNEGSGGRPACVALVVRLSGPCGDEEGFPGRFRVRLRGGRHA